MPSSPLTKFYVAIAAVLLVGFAIIFAWQLSGRDWVAYLIFGWVFVGTWILGQVKCPQCEAPVAYGGNFGRLHILTALGRRKCNECGRDLTR